MNLKGKFFMSILFIPVLIQSCIFAFAYLRFSKLERVIDNYCPNNNYAQIYYNVTDTNIIKSIEMKYFAHCGAWCIFDHRDPRSGWFWEPHKKEWNYLGDLYKVCPEDEFNYAFDRFLENGC